MRRAPRPAVGDSESGFGVVEAMVAVTILAIALMLSIQPLMASLNRLDGSQNLSAAEKLAQSEIEAIQALDYDDVGLPGFTPRACCRRRARWRSAASATPSKSRCATPGPSRG